MNIEKECEVCKSFQIRFLFKKDNYNYQKCQKCGLIRIYPQPTNEQLDAVYNAGGGVLCPMGGRVSFFSYEKKHI
jgi:hypothetical protein